MGIVKCFRTPGLSGGQHNVVLKKLQSLTADLKIKALHSELCFYVLVGQEKESGISAEEQKKLLWLLRTPFQENCVSTETFLKKTPTSLLIEIGPRLNFSTAFSTNAVSMCHSIGWKSVSRLEYSTRYLIELKSKNVSGDNQLISKVLEKKMIDALHDRMTQCFYREPINTFELTHDLDPVYDVDVINQGRTALEKVNLDMGLAFDDWDLDYYTEMFQEKIKRNPTNVECFDLAQSNSEHSRHWFFKGRMVIDGKENEDSLFQMVMNTQQHSNPNNVIKFCDNSSSIKGFPVKLLYPENSSQSSAFKEVDGITRHVILTAETHNFPTGVAPFPGATTGTGGRIRDVQATGIGAHVVAGTAGYCFGNLNIPGYRLPWEDADFDYPSNFASPLEIAIEASNGASDYGNKFGEPVLAGFARSFGMVLQNGERREWIKPIMFSAGLGSIDHIHCKKSPAEKGMDVVKLGGPVYRIGVGGGAASSVKVQGDNASELDFAAVQRGDAEMEQKLNRVIRACIEMGKNNPIKSIHDQGAGGNGNVLKEIVEPAGAIIQVKDFQLGDPTISILELWGAEYQESNAILVKAKDSDILRKICLREKCPVCFVGTVTGDGMIRLENLLNSDPETGKKKSPEYRFPVDLHLECVLGSMPRKTFHLDRSSPVLMPFNIPDDLTLQEALDRVLRLPAVSSKRYLTNKVDRSVTGLVAQQQCVGPLHTPLADVAVTALSHFDTVGAATAIGEQPIKGLLDAGCGARMSVGEALTNLVFARVTSLKDVKCSGNWMWPAKLPGEGAALFDACKAMCDVMARLGVAIDGGKDSLSMAARVNDKTIKAPGALVISAYAACPDVRATVTPDLKVPGGCLLWVDLSCGKQRLGGSALAQCFGHLGNQSPDLNDPDAFSQAFNFMQELIKDGIVLAGHDISDGGLVTCILEMAFAGNCGVHINIPTNSAVSSLDILFAEELGWVIEVDQAHVQEIINRFQTFNVKCDLIGHSEGVFGPQAQISISITGRNLLVADMAELRQIWEETSYQLENLQANPDCITQERNNLKNRCNPPYTLTFDPAVTPISQESNGIQNGVTDGCKPVVGVIREEGSNGDREMVSALHFAGFEVWDINMQDLCSGVCTLEQFRGVVFVGGFSYADVLGSAKGWAATILFNPTVRAQFATFRARSDTFSLGVCNGCQLMALLGWVAPALADSNDDDSIHQGVFLDHNKSERFESRFTTVKIENSPSIMLKDMEGTIMGIWIAHGEGQMIFKTEEIYTEQVNNNLVPVRYVDDSGQPTESYPFNPNGSPAGIAALCSSDGRHLAIMPHPERCVLPWQWAWMPSDWKLDVSPWLRMFQNAYIWCCDNQ